jgi:hypothetical protein
MPVVKDAVNRWMDALTAGFTEEEKETAYALVSRMSENAREYVKNCVSSPWSPGRSEFNRRLSREEEKNLDVPGRYPWCTGNRCHLSSG